MLKQRLKILGAMYSNCHQNVLTCDIESGISNRTEQRPLENYILFQHGVNQYI